jgi:predicted ATPase/class 3 adenylate cyclase
MISIAGYNITTTLYESSRTAVYRGTRQCDQVPVVLKTLNVEYPEADDIARFKREYEIMQMLHVEGVLEVYGLEKYDHSLLMILEDFGGEALSRVLASRKLQLAEFLQIALAVTRILGEIHQQQVLHKDINPSNILWNPDTHHVKIIDFGISAVLPHEHPAITNLDVLEGTLAYMSPEQTGRMNRSLDFRSDFYSLGVTLYELLLGFLPFQTTDKMELLHCHLARAPQAPHELNQNIPKSVSGIVMKLMAKMPEDRYQSTRGLSADLQQCLEQLTQTGQIRYIAIGSQDVPECFHIPQRLYGRGKHTDRVLAAFARIKKAGGRECVMVAGPDGIGKSAFLRELQPLLVKKSGCFITVSCEQSTRRHTPYLPLVQACQALLRQILTESREGITQWKQKLLSAIGEHGRLALEILPQIKLILGNDLGQPAEMPENDPYRKTFLLKRLLQVFMTPKHPLVLGVDDIQHADPASVQLFQQLLLTDDSHHLLLIGTYREKDLSAEHPVQILLQEAGDRISHLVLTPFSLEELNQVLADTFRCPSKETIALAKVVLKKTLGNPFAVKEFLKSLYEEELVLFDAQAGAWKWHLEQIQGMALSDNVVELMTTRIQKLPDHVKRLLQLAACIGNRFDLHTLAHAQNKSEAATVKDLHAAVREGLLLPTDETYKYVHYFEADDLRQFAPHVMYDFVHNHVREAVESMISADQQAVLHLAIGRHLLHCELLQDEQENNLMTIVHHLNLATHLLRDPEEKVELARLNLLAGRYTKAAASYQSALQYVTAGITLLGKTGWQQHYALMFALVKEQAEIEYLHGNFEQSEQLLDLALAQARSNIHQVQLYTLRIVQYTLQAKYHDAIRVGRTALALLNTALPDEADLQAVLQTEIVQLKKHLRAQNVAELIQRPDLAIPVHHATLQILDALILPTFQVQQPLYQLVVTKILNICLQYGLAPEAAFGFAQYGDLLGSAWGYYRAGYEFGMLAVRITERFGDEGQKCKTLGTLVSELLPWTKHVKHAHELADQAYQAGVYSGELQCAGLTLMHKVLNVFCAGDNLEQILADLPQFLHFSQKPHNQMATDVMTGCRLIIHNLCGLSSDRLTFDGDGMDETRYLAQCRETPGNTALAVYWTLKAQVLYLYGVTKQALQLAVKAVSVQETFMSFMIRVEHNFYYSLSLAARISHVAESEAQRYREQLETNQKQMKIWADNCPDNFQHKYLLVQAEKARLGNNPFAAMQLYKQAIQTAKEHEFIQDEALSHELAARFYLRNGFKKIAELHLKEAYANYQLWGAKRKAALLLDHYPQLLSDKKQPQTDHLQTDTRSSTKIAIPTTEKGLSILDLHTVMKATQAISGEIELANLLKKMMKIAIENAGAQKGWLILHKDDQWYLEAASSVEQDEVEVLQTVPIPLETEDSEQETELLPCSLIRYVIRTTEPLVLTDAARSGSFTNDHYIASHQAKSVLCTPLIKQGRMIGILYLENNLTTGAFTPDRLELLNMLLSQMAISIENATLYKQLKEALSQQIQLSDNQVELTNAYSRFVPSEFLSLLNKKSIVDVRLGDQVEEEITVMFSDIRGFTPLSEQMSPQENFNFINSYLSQMGPIIRDYHGFIDKYIGDAIMALFPTDADEAVQASIAMLKQLEHYNQGRQRAGYQPIQIGIGLNTGMLMLGTVGEQDRMDGTVISDAVNLASRIEGMTKIYGVSLLISETTYFQLQDASKYAIRIIDQVQAKGKSEPVTVFEVFDGDPPDMIDRKLKTLVLFKQGFKMYHQTKFAGANALFNEVLRISETEKLKQIEEAQELFNEILHVNPNDKVAQIYVQRCENIKKYGVSEEWAGVWAWIEALQNR